MFYGARLYLFCCVSLVCALCAQIVPSDPVLNFRLPQFAKNGYTKWVLEGGKGIYDSAEQIRVEDMSLRVYSADERMALEMTMKSPEATLLIKENKAVSDESIEIVGTNFKVSGVGWTWDGETKEIEVKFDAVVEFTQDIGGILSDKPTDGKGAEGKRTEISSRSMSLKTTPEAYRFEFTDSVQVTSGDTVLNSGLLVALADAPREEGQSDTSMVADMKFDSISHITATDQVVISQGNRVLHAGRAEFLVREEVARFYENPRIETPEIRLNGAMMRSEKKAVLVLGSEESGRVKMEVAQVGGLGISADIPAEQETILFADRVKMEEFEAETQFTFDGSVEVTSGSMKVRANRLTLFTDPATTQTKDTSDNSTYASKVGEVVRVVAEGSVKIEGEYQEATCNKVVFHPQEKQAELSGSPQVNHNEVIITGKSMSLKPGFAQVNGSRGQPARVALPEVPDLGYANIGLVGAPASVPATPGAGESETIIQAQTLQMIENIGYNLFKFTDTVSVNGNNLNATCERMDVVVTEQTDQSTGRAIQTVQTVKAYENVVFKQSGRTATADTVSIMPVEGKIVLEGNPVVTDEKGQVTGHRITLLQGEGRAIVEGDQSKGTRPRITLPEVNSLNINELDR